MNRYLYVPLTADERRQLADLAHVERRELRQQAAVLLSRALRETTAATEPPQPAVPGE